LRHSCNEVHAKLQALGIWFGDSPSLFDHLVKSKHETLNLSNGQSCSSKESAFYDRLFNETFDTHDALEDVIREFGMKLSLYHNYYWVCKCILLRCMSDRTFNVWLHTQYFSLHTQCFSLHTQYFSSHIQCFSSHTIVQCCTLNVSVCTLNVSVRTQSLNVAHSVFQFLLLRIKLRKTTADQARKFTSLAIQNGGESGP
jgi:hypothetical protein